MTFKESLLEIMKLNVDSLLQLHDCDHSKAVHDDAVTDEICSILETVFMHNFSGRTNSLFIATPTQLNQRSFWDFVSSILPKHISSLITNCSAGRTPIGRCRVWLRYCLNESTLISYLTLVTTDSPKLCTYYTSDAALRDSDFMRLFIHLIESISVLHFRLDLKSPLLSTWINSKVPIYLGWSVEKVDEAESNLLQDSDSQLEALISPLLVSSHSPLKFSNFENLTDPNSDSIESVVPVPIQRLAEKSSDSDISNESDHVDATPSEPASSVTAKSPRRLVRKTYARSQLNVQSQFPVGSNNLLNQFRSTWLAYYTELKTTEESTSADQPSSTVESCHPQLPHVIQPNQTVFILEGESSPWQVVGEDLLVQLTEQDMHRLVALYPGASVFDANKGKNCAFNGCCIRCGRHLSQGSAYLDNYDACLYCVNCHQLQEAVIPRDVIFNWDFSLQLVSQTTKSFLSGAYSRPIINVAKQNPLLYAVIPDLLVVRQLRRTLILLWDQLCRCDAKAASDLRHAVGTLDYMLYDLNDLDVYSLRDLCLVPDRVLEKKLMFAICEVALIHVHSCRSCRRRALVCSLCENVRKPIWPHEFTTYQWCATPGCSNVLHIDCIRRLRTFSTDEPSCFGCYPMIRIPKPSPEPNNFSGALCATCETHALHLSPQKLGHYADPVVYTPPTSIASELTSQLTGWLNSVSEHVGSARAIIVPHAGYRYSGQCAAYAYKQLDPMETTRVFIIGPSHHANLGSNCALSEAAVWKTPLHDLNVDQKVYEALEETGEFVKISKSRDEREHSLEMQLPYIAHVMNRRKDDYTIVPIVVGSLTPDREKLYGQLLSPYLADPSNVFVISSDFCHWGKRFNYQYYEKSDGDVWESIEKLDQKAMMAMKQLDPCEFQAYLTEYRNTICGRRCISVLLNCLDHLRRSGQDGSKFDLEFLHYAQSNKCQTVDDSSVSYVAAALVAK